MSLVLRRTFLFIAGALVLGLATIGAASLARDTAELDRPAAIVSGATGSAGGGATADDPVVADLDAVLAANSATKAPAVAATRGQLRRLAAWNKIVHATVVVDLPALGGLTTIQLDHGTVSAVTGTSLTIAEAGGGSVTISLGAETRVRRAGAKSAIANLKSADEVFVMSKVGASGAEAYLVVVRKT